ncbi:MAG: endopeptidase La, partial [Lachnospiraceae bacterium]|nr:endopeptidase La [Lachnospiraceae bacterium]
IYLKTDYYQKMTGKVPVVDDRITIVILKEELSRSDMQSDSFYPIGITGSIIEVNENGYIVIHLKNRINITEVTVFPSHAIDLSIEKRGDIDDLDREEAEKRLMTLKSDIVRFSDNYQMGAVIRGYAARWSRISEIAAAMSPWMINPNKDRYAVLAEDSLRKRFDMLEKMIYENLELTKVQAQAKTAQEEDYQKIYRESAIKKQMEYLQKEMDDLHPESVSDIRRLELKLEESNMNETAKKEGRKILNRLKSEGHNSAESGMLLDYLDFLTSLPWDKEEAKTIKLDDARAVLEEDHFGLKKVKKRIIEQIAVMNLKGEQSGSILLFVGAPGTGKTSIGQSIARALDRKYVRVSLGGVRDEADIRGHRRTYIGSMPGRIIDGIEKSGVSNPVMVLDEVDKLSQSYNGDPASALLEVLDPEQNSTFTDHYLNVPYDLSDVLFICTANTLDTIPEPLLNRMEVIDFQGYTPIDKLSIAKEHLVPKALKAVGIPEGTLEITDEALDKIIEDYTREAGVRGLKKRIDTICRSAAVKLVENYKDPQAEKKEGTKDQDQVPGLTDNAGSFVSEGDGSTDADEIINTAEPGNAPAGSGKDSGSETGPVPETGSFTEKEAEAGNTEIIASAETDTEADKAEKTEEIENLPSNIIKITVTPDNLKDFLDMSPVHHKFVKKKANPGIVTGLAWTSVGGDILYIETMFTRGSGKLIITGQLGDVMKESAQIAVSLVKALLPDKAELFSKNDLHIHVPDGATPKDGPSAGITLTTAIASLVTGNAVTPRLAMTGEVSLQGNVNPIGGLPEKLMAAHRAGVKKVFIPRDNEFDLKDVAKEVKEALEIIPVDTVEDVLTEAGVLKKNKKAKLKAG